MIPLHTRREMLRTIGGGFGSLGLLGVLAQEVERSARADAANPLAPKPPQFKPKAKRVIFLFMNGGPSHIDTFDPKPALSKHSGQTPPDSLAKGQNRQSGRTLMGSPFSFAKYGKSGIDVSELYPELAAPDDEGFVE